MNRSLLHHLARDRRLSHRSGAPAHSSGATEPPATDERLQGAYRFERDGWIYVHLEGPPERSGFQHGYLLAAEIADFLRVIKPYLEKSTHRDWGFYRQAAEKMLWPRIDQEYRREIDGIVAGIEVQGGRGRPLGPRRPQRQPGAALLLRPLARSEGREDPDHSAPGNCSAFIATGSHTRDGRIVMGHNAWTNYVVGTRWNIVFDIKPEAGSRFIMDGLPGVIVSDDDFGVNSAGHDDHRDDHHPVRGLGPRRQTRVRPCPQGHAVQPVDRRLRPDHARRQQRRLCQRLADRRQQDRRDRALRAGPQEPFGPPHQGRLLLRRQLPRSPKLRKEETRFDAEKRSSSPNARKLRWEQLMAEHKGKIDLELGKRFENDDFDVITGKNGANERTLCGRVETSPRGVPEWDWGPFYPGGTVQSKVIDGNLADQMAFWGQVGHHGSDFVADTSSRNTRNTNGCAGCSRT